MNAGTESKSLGKPALAQLLLLGLLLVCSLVDITRSVSFGTVTLMGVFTLFACGAAWAIFLMRPTVRRDLLKPMLPLIMFQVYAAGSMLWYPPSVRGLQLLAVGLGFHGLILLTAREAAARPAFAHTLQKALLICTAIPVLIYLCEVLDGGLGADEVIGRVPSRSLLWWRPPLRSPAGGPAADGAELGRRSSS